MKHHAICSSKHFGVWKELKPQEEHPDPECFVYNDWGNPPPKKKDNQLQVEKAIFLATAGGAVGAVPTMPADLLLVHFLGCINDTLDGIIHAGLYTSPFLVGK